MSALIPTEDAVMLERLRHDSASRGPSYTFHCAKCKQRKTITGRRKVAGAWCCGSCVGQAGAVSEPFSNKTTT